MHQSPKLTAPETISRSRDMAGAHQNLKVLLDKFGNMYSCGNLVGSSLRAVECSELVETSERDMRT